MDIDEAAFPPEERYVPLPGKPMMYSISPAPPHHASTMGHYLEEEEARLREERDDVVSASVWRG